MNNLKIPISNVDLLLEIWVINVNLNIHSIETFVYRLKKVNKSELGYSFILTNQNSVCCMKFNFE